MSRYALNYHDEWKRAELCNDLDFTHDLIVKAMQDLDVYLTPLVIWGAPPQTFSHQPWLYCQWAGEALNFTTLGAVSTHNDHKHRTGLLLLLLSCFCRVQLCATP